ncbi:hypothetical protein Bpfe_023168 [Biomphalaria pfeifferi]|uniref:SUEL-type lectin domain-containing protein n=1 Tax=Biomphalaria pfeifferi TaxID=112525 RepID=A0AAD8B3Q3_BIOPF|nr:hypothetical protein Bpfe_023168 [Biomphalaria pfeifferi]
MLFVKQVLSLNLLIACVIAAEKKEDKIHTEVFNVNYPFPRQEKKCTNRGILLQYFRLLADGCESDSKMPIFLDGNISFLWIDLQRRCTGKNKCNMKNFVLPTLYFRCNNNTDVLASKFDVAFSCEPLKGESVYSVTINSTAIIKDLDKPKYLVHNDLSNDSNYIVCTIKALENKNISIQLLYVDWNMAPKCDDSQENVPIGNTVYSCQNSTHIMSEQTFKTEARIGMFKQRGLVWIKFKVNIAHNLKCEIQTIVINKTKERPSDTEVLNIPKIFVPVVVLFILLVVCGLLLYRLRYARGGRQRSTHEYGDYSTINENYMTSPTTTESQGAYYHVDTEMLLLQSSTTAYKDLQKEANTLAANVYQVTLTNDDQTYAEVNKKPKSIQTQVQVNASSSQVSSSEDLSAKGDNVYAHLAHLQGKKETDNIYNS